MAPAVHHLAGTVYLDQSPIDLTDAVNLRFDVIDDFIPAMKAHAVDELQRLSHLEIALRRAINDAWQYRKAAGWVDVFGADRRVA